MSVCRGLSCVCVLLKQMQHKHSFIHSFVVHSNNAQCTSFTLGLRAIFVIVSFAAKISFQAIFHILRAHFTNPHNFCQFKNYKFLMNFRRIPTRTNRKMNNHNNTLAIEHWNMILSASTVLMHHRANEQISKNVNNHLNCNTDHFECMTNEFCTHTLASIIRFDSCTNLWLPLLVLVVQ